MADKEIAIKIDIQADTGAKSLGSLRKEFKETQKELNGLEQGTEQYIATLKKLGSIKDEIGDLNSEIKAFTPEGKIQAFGNAIGGLASGFQAAQGAAALLGLEGEELQKTLLKVQAASAFADGIKGVIGMGDAFKELGLIIKSNPIGAVVTAVTALAGAAVMLYNSFDTASQTTKDLNRELEKQKNITASLAKSTSRQVELLVAQGGSEREIIDIKEKLAKAQLLELSLSIKQHESKVQDTKDNDSIWESTLRVTAAIQSKLGNEQLANQLLQSLQINKRERAQEDLDAIEKEKEDLLDLQNQIEILSAQRIIVEKKETKALKDELQKQRDEDLKAANERADLINKEADNLDAKKKREKEAEKASVREFVAEYVAAEKEKQDAIFALQKFHNEQTFAGKIEQLHIERDAELAEVGITEERKQLIRAEYAKKESDLRTANFLQHVQLSEQALQATQQLTDIGFNYALERANGNAKKEREIKKKQFKLNKAFSIAQIILNTIMGITQALGNNPPPLSWITAGINSAMGTAATIKAAMTKFDGDAGGGDGGGASIGSIGASGGGIALAPPSTGNTQLNSDGSVKQEIMNKTPMVKAIVVETDITSKQKGVNTIEERAKL